MEFLPDGQPQKAGDIISLLQAAQAKPVQIVVLGDRPTVQEITAKVHMTKLTAKQIFPHLVFDSNEDHVILTEIMRPAKAGEPIACVHGASGQKFVVSHYELDGVRL